MDPVTGTACLLLHGFGGTPFEMEALAPPLRNMGCTVSLPLYPGHGTTIAAFRRTLFADWLGCAEEHFRALAAGHDAVIPVGFSMGGSIALTLAAKFRDSSCLAGVVALSPAYSIYRRYLFVRRLRDGLRGLVSRGKSREKRHGGSASRTIAPYQGYEDAAGLAQALSLGAGLRNMRALLEKIVCPVFMMADVNDRICPPDSFLRIARAVSSRDVSARWVRMREQVTSHHMLTTHGETRDCVAGAVAAFVGSVAR